MRRWARFGLRSLWKEEEEEAEILQEVIDSFWEKLKERGYVMPPGLIWIGGGVKRECNFCVKLMELPEFRLDTIVTEAVDEPEYSQR